MLLYPLWLLIGAHFQTTDRTPRGIVRTRRVRGWGFCFGLVQR